MGDRLTQPSCHVDREVNCFVECSPPSPIYTPIASSGYYPIACCLCCAGVLYAVKEMDKKILKSKSSVHTVIRELACSLAAHTPYVVGFEFSFCTGTAIYMGMVGRECAVLFENGCLRIARGVGVD